jgi:hypothetical protein
MAVTNHALDHLLRSLHEHEVTRSMLRLGTRTKDDIVARYLLSTAERQRKPDKKHREKLRTMEAVRHSYGSTNQRTDEQQMRELSALITAPWPTDAQVEEYLARHHPRMLSNLNKPPAWAKDLFEDHLKAGRQILLTTGQEPAYTLWTYWLRGYDLNHIADLQSPSLNVEANGDAPGPSTHSSPRFDKPSSAPQERTAANGRPIKPLPKVNRIETRSMKREISVNEEKVDVKALIMQTTRSMGGLRLEGSDDFEIKREVGVRVGEPDNGLYDFMFAQPAKSLTTQPRSIKSESLPAPFEQGVGGIPKSGTHMAPAEAQDEENKERVEKLRTFLARFKLNRLPFIPTTTRSLDDLLAKDHVWTFSKDERAKVSEYIALQAKEELEDHALAPFRKLVEAYEVARKDFEQARQEVR